MKSKVFVVYDAKVEAYLTPHILRSRGEAIRGFGHAVNDANSLFNKSPADFTYFEIGEYDDQTGVISMYEAKVPLGTAVEFINAMKETCSLT